MIRMSKRLSTWLDVSKASKRAARANSHMWLVTRLIDKALRGSRGQLQIKQMSLQHDDLISMPDDCFNHELILVLFLFTIHMS